MKLKLLPVLLFLCYTNSLLSQKKAEKGADSIVVRIAPEYDHVSRAHRILFGETYRKLWAAPVKVRIIHLATEKGGLTIVEKGGGLQTKSLKLKDASGREWALRSIQKYPERALPPRLKATIAKDILQDQVATGHPFAALTVPPFAAALGIEHSNPEVVYLPDDPALGKYKADFANSVLLLEERDPLNSTDTDNSEKVEKKLEDDTDNKVDQRMVLRARLLDLFLGDWDRHEGQWRWDKKKDESGVVYLPVPRDRDKVYYNTSGILPWLLSHQALKSNLQGFHKDVRDIAGYNFNNRYFDRYFLNQLNENDWNNEITYVTNTLTDNLIRSAVRRLPDTIYALSGEKIIKTLIERRSMLRKEALKYYQFISLRVDVPASDKNDFFEINHKDDGNVAVGIYKIKKDGSKDKISYQREFDKKVTKEIRLYGFEGNDIFTVNGTAKSPIKVRMIGGKDIDSFYVNNGLYNKRKLYIYDRSDQQNVLPPSALFRNKTSADTSVNKYDIHNFKYDKLGPLAAVAYNLDQGTLLRVGFSYEKHGFRKEPFAEKHMLTANYATSKHSFMFEYSAYLTKVIKDNDLSIDLVSKGPKNVSNFFGIGNETVFLKNMDDAINYYRNHYDVLSGNVRLHRKITESFSINGGMALLYYTSSSSNNQDHFFKSYDAFHPNENIFSDNYYAGVVGGTTFDTRNNGLFANKGVFWNTELIAMNHLNGNRKSYGQIYSDFSFYIPVSADSNIVIANRIGGGTTVGSPAFFQQMQLGGVHNLRGFHTYRFTGKTMFFHNIDLRFKLFDFNSYLFPGTIGIVGFNDIGRVWVPGEASNKWHDGYGGGVYIVPAELVLIQALVGHSVEGTLPYISIGFTF
jgi:hypothetical protein